MTPRKRNTTPSPRTPKRPGARLLVWGLVLSPILISAAYLLICILLLIPYKWMHPLITGVQMQRIVEQLADGERPVWDYRPLPPDQISRHLPRAAVAAEDGRFFEHSGVDWEAMQKALEENRRGRRIRGGSTITQQLVKNLFMTTHRSYIRKAFEIPLAYAAEIILGKDRILHLYVNVIEWGPGVYGAEAAAQYHYRKPAERLSRREAAGLAACIPSPRVRTPQRMGWYRNIILRRMSQHGW